MRVTPDNHLEFLKTFVVGRESAYAVQDKSGRYRKVEKQLTDAALLRHLQHKISIGSYTTNDDGRCKFVLWDIDNHEGKEIVPSDIVKGKVMKLITTLRSFDIPHLLAESSPGSFHIYVMFTPAALTEEAYDFGRWVARNAGVGDVECFPKQREVPPGEYGNLIRMPFSVHAKKRTTYHYIDENFEHIDEFQVQTIDISGFSSSHSMKPPAVSTEDEMVHPSTPSISSSGGIPPCLSHLLESGAELTGGSGHYTRIAITCAYHDAGLNHPALCRLFSKQADYDEVETAKQVHSVLKKSGGYSYSCFSLREKCSKFVGGMCSTCTRGKRFK